MVVLSLLLLIVFTGEGREQLTPVEDALLALFAPAQTAFSSAGQKLQSLFDAIVSFYELKAENDLLSKKISFLEQQLIQFQELQKENYRYRELLEFKEESDHRLLAAEVIARDPSQWFGSITINRGYLDGVRQEMVVTTGRGLVGMISTVSPHSSQVLLITDPRLPVSAMIQRTRDPVTVGIVAVSYTHLDVYKRQALLRGYFPLLLLLAVPTGIFTGLAAYYLEGVTRRAVSYTHLPG